MAENPKLRLRELKLGDVVIVLPGPYGTATVKQIKAGMVTFFRPYVHTADFSYTGGVLCYVGIEEFTSYIDSDPGVYELLCRSPLK